MARDAQPDSSVLGNVLVALAHPARCARPTRLRRKQRQPARNAARDVVQRAHEAHARAHPRAQESRPVQVRQRSPSVDLLNSMATDHPQDFSKTRRLSRSGGFSSSFMKEKAT